MDEKSRSPVSLKKWSLAHVMIGLVCAATIAGFLGRWWWLFDLACHFRVQYFWLLAFGSTYLLIRRQFRAAGVSAAFALMNVVLVVPLYLGGPVDAAESSHTRIFSVNVFSDNKRHDEVLELIRETDPDVVVMFEVNRRWVTAMHKLESTYPFSTSVPREDNFGVAIYSRVPIDNIEIKPLQEDIPAIVARLKHNSRPLTIICGHVVPPGNKRHSNLRNQQLTELAAVAASNESAVLLVGDLNCTSWSPFFSDLIRDSGLRDSRQGFGIQATWNGLGWLFRIPIDHCLVSSDIIVHDRRIASVAGSDHDAVTVDVSVRQP